MMWGELIAQIKEEELDKKTCSPKLTRNPHGIMKNGGSRRGETWRRKKAAQIVVIAMMNGVGTSATIIAKAFPTSRRLITAARILGSTGLELSQLVCIVS